MGRPVNVSDHGRHNLNRCHRVCSDERREHGQAVSWLLTYCDDSDADIKGAIRLRRYHFVKLEKPEEFRFCPQYNPISAVLGKALRLWKAHRDHPRDRLSIIDAITAEHCDSIQFNNSWLEDLSEKILLKMTADRVTPMVANPGRVVLTDSILYFQPFNNINPEPVQKFRLSKVFRVVRRRYLLRQVGLELFLRDGPVVFLSCDTEAARDSLCEAIRKFAEAESESENQGNMMLQWQNGELSNFDYLMYLNRMADRSFNDLTQYVVSLGQSSSLGLTPILSIKGILFSLGSSPTTLRRSLISVTR